MGTVREYPDFKIWYDNQMGHQQQVLFSIY
jgi:hypothetical protein